jgi:hypothetical protein
LKVCNHGRKKGLLWVGSALLVVVGLLSVLDHRFTAEDMASIVWVKPTLVAQVALSSGRTVDPCAMRDSSICERTSPQPMSCAKADAERVELEEQEWSFSASGNRDDRNPSGPKSLSNVYDLRRGAGGPNSLSIWSRLMTSCRAVVRSVDTI